MQGGGMSGTRKKTKSFWRVLVRIGFAPLTKIEKPSEAIPTFCNWNFPKSKKGIKRIQQKLRNNLIL